jgi:hypothetical protein
MTARSDRLVVLAYITAIAMPPIGLILGIVVATRPTISSKHGASIIVLSIIACALWFLVLASGVLTTPSNDGGY